MRIPMNRTHPRNVLAAVLLVVGFHSAPALCCDVDGTGTAKHIAAPMPAATAVAAPAPAAKPAPVVAATQPATVAGGAAPSDDAGNNLGDGAVPGTHRRGLRWQSFLPGVIK